MFDVKPVHQRRLYWSPGMEGHGWANRLFGTDRFYHFAVGLDRTATSALIDNTHRIFAADFALYRTLDRRPSILQLNTRRPLYLLWCRTLQRGLKIK